MPDPLPCPACGSEHYGHAQEWAANMDRQGYITALREQIRNRRDTAAQLQKHAQDDIREAERMERIIVALENMWSERTFNDH